MTAPPISHVFIVGAQKAGTTFLHNLLRQHPRIASFPVKEPHFFSSAWRTQFAIDEHFDADSHRRVVLDSSASYLHHSSTAERIADQLGTGCAIIVMIRSPIDRAVSAYLHSLKNGRDIRSIGEAFDVRSRTYDDIFAEESDRILVAHRKGKLQYVPTSAYRMGDEHYDDPSWNYRYISNSFYHSQALPFLERFARVRVVDFDDVVTRPLECLAAVHDFIGLEPQVRADLDVETNRTVLTKSLVARKFARNVISGQFAPLSRKTAALVRGGLGIPVLDLDVKSTVDQLRAEWSFTDAILADHEAMKKLALRVRHIVDLDVGDVLERS